MIVLTQWRGSVLLALGSLGLHSSLMGCNLWSRTIYSHLPKPWKNISPPTTPTNIYVLPYLFIESSQHHTLYKWANDIDSDIFVVTHNPNIIVQRDHYLAHQQKRKKQTHWHNNLQSISTAQNTTYIVESIKIMISINNYLLDSCRVKMLIANQHGHVPTRALV